MAERVALNRPRPPGVMLDSIRFGVVAVQGDFVAQQSKTAVTRNVDSREHSQPHGSIVLGV
jgi:hypothetical protein